MMKPEQSIQIAVCDWLRKHHPELPFMHIANERRCSPQAGALLKRMGVKPGVSDLFFPRGNSNASGLWLELKSETGRATPAQISFMKEMRLEGYEAEVAYSWQEALQYISMFYGL